jgi:hypothetical protein
MIGFLIKKTFFDIWDNLLKIALVNIGFIASLAFLVFIPGLVVNIAVPLAILANLVGVLWLFIYFQATAFTVRSVSDYASFGFADFFNNVKIAVKPGLALGLPVFVLFFLNIFTTEIDGQMHFISLITVIFQFYLTMPNPYVGILMAAVIFWALVVAVLSLQWFFPIRARLDTKLSKVFKKCFIIFFDNPGFSLFCFIHDVVILGLSLFVAFLIPGTAGVQLYQDEALRLRLLKYDWFEDNPEAVAEAQARRKKPKVPWEVVLIDEREKTGTRTFRNFIFPWKD